MRMDGWKCQTKEGERGLEDEKAGGQQQELMRDNGKTKDRKSGSLNSKQKET